MRRVAFAIFTLALAIGCGGSKPDVAAAGDPAPSGGACEPGRCLEDISARIDDHRPAARACYEAGHDHDPTLQGRLVINFEIDPEGTVTDAAQGSQDDQLTDASVVDCVLAVVRAVKFAQSARGKSTRAFHRYDFSPP